MVRFENVGMRYSSGPEVLREGMKVLNAAATKFGFKFETTNYDIGGERYMKTGEILPDSVLDEFRKQVGALHPLGHMGEPDDVAYGVLPASLYETIRTRWLAAYDAGKIAQVKRIS